MSDVSLLFLEEHIVKIKWTIWTYYLKVCFIKELVLFYGKPVFYWYFVNFITIKTWILTGWAAGSQKGSGKVEGNPGRGDERSGELCWTHSSVVWWKRGTHTWAGDWEWGSEASSGYSRAWGQRSVLCLFDDLAAEWKRFKMTREIWNGRFHELYKNWRASEKLSVCDKNWVTGWNLGIEGMERTEWLVEI